MNRFPITTAGHERLQIELRELKTVKRPAITKAIETAREHGDLKENAEYHAAREEQSLSEARITDLESKLSNAQVIDPSTLSKDRILFGSTAIIVNVDTDEELTFQIVSQEESNITEGLISNTSPIGRSLLTKEPGDLVKVHTPRGLKEFEVLQIL